MKDHFFIHPHYIEKKKVPLKTSWLSNAFGKTASKTIRIFDMYLIYIPNSIARWVLWLKQTWKPDLCNLEEVA